MYAVIETGGKQYKVQKGETVDIERLTGDAGAKIIFDKVLMVSDSKTPNLGHPYVDGVTVDAEIATQFRGKKLVVYKKKRRKGFERKLGHRQNLTKVTITAINA